MNFKAEFKKDITLFFSKGEWTLKNINKIRSSEYKKAIKKANDKTLIWDFSQLEKLDSSGSVLILKLIDIYRAKGASIVFKNMQTSHQKLFLFYRKNHVTLKSQLKRKKDNPFEIVGKKIVKLYEHFIEYVSFVGELFIHLFLTFVNPFRFRFSALVKHLEESGLKAMPIVTLTSFLVGLVVAYQGAFQLKKFGANIFIVDMTAISIFRELAPMIAAIVIAGRSASAYTAEIGTLKITEEIDAMRTMGFHPMRFLVIPRIVALMISMPLIVFFADMVGLYGGMVVADFDLGISYADFLNRIQTQVDIKHLYIGLIKAPVFGFMIATIGCFRGFQVTGSTESIGRYTTISVVNAIFWVIAINALISVLLTEIGL